ncbi:NAD(P)-binding protein [Hyaloscypha variabilis]
MPSYVVVGASRGLGYEWLRQLSNESANTVIGLVRTPDTVQKRLETDSMQSVHLVAGDMADNDSLVAAAAETEKFTGGSVDYLIINGVYTNPSESFLFPSEFSGKEELLTNSMTQSLKVNVLGVVFSINAFLPLVRKSKIKKIIVISTGLADRDMVEKSTISFLLTYSSMKAALNMVVAKYAVELKSEGILLLALSPGLVDTTADNEFKALKPDFAGPITPSESVIAQRKVIEDLAIENTGAFLSHHGNKSWL